MPVRELASSLGTRGGPRLSWIGARRVPPRTTAWLHAVVLRRRRRNIPDCMPQPRRHRAPLIGFALALVVVALGVWKASFVAGASDAYGYVSEGDLIAHGRLTVEQQFVRTLPWPFADWSFAPAGYRPATERGVIVPTYPIGVPLLMALFQRVAGRNAVFYVVPVLGGLSVWMTVLIGTAVQRPLTGLLSGILLATSPIFAVELMAPASDVAATSWWTIALVGALRDTPLGAAAAGLGASAAVLTRPNLVLLDVVLAGFFALSAINARGDDRRHAIRKLALFGATALLGGVMVAVINDRLYGAPFRSGYESLDALFRWSNAAANLDRYPRWLLQSQTPFIALGLLAPWLVRRHAAHDPPPLSRRGTALLLAFAAVVCVSYVFYRPFGPDEWTYLRFLLPAYPALIVLAVAVTIAAARGAAGPRTRADAFAVAVCALVAVWQAREAIHRGAFAARAIERRYVDVGHYVETMLPADTLCIARLHAGSIRYYAGRLTLYYDWLQPRWLDGAVRELAARGYDPVIVIEAAEEPAFRDRFGELNTLGRLDWPAAAELASPVRVRIYDPADRERFRRGDRITTRQIQPWTRFR